MHRKGGSLPQRLAQLVIGLILLLAPWLFGAVEEWSWRLLQCLTLLAVLLVLYSPHRTWNWWWGGSILAVAVYLAVQAANPSHRFEPVDRSLVPLSHVAWLPHTADAATTWQTMLKFLTYAGLFWATRMAFTERHHVWALLAVLVVSGFVMAIVGLMQKLSGTELMLGLRKGGWFFFGPFVNRNNYVSYINLLIPVALAVSHHRRHVALAEGARSHPGGLFAFMALVMVLSVVMTTSRAGTVVCAGMLLAWGAVELAHVVRGGGEGRRALLVVMLAAVALMTGLLYLGTQPIEQRLGEMRDVPAELAGSGGRGTVYKATMQMFRERWLYGIGGGTFSMTYPYYSAERMDWFRRYAHNDWLQYLAELGALGTVLLGLFPFGLLREWIKHGETLHLGGMLDWMAIALGIALAGMALHALVDFPLHIPAVATLAVAWLAILTQPLLRRHHETR